MRKVSRFSGIILILSTFVLSVSGCETLRDLLGFEDWRQTTENVLNDGIAELAKESSNWQHVLQEMQDKLTKDLQSTIKNEIANLASRSIATGGVEFRCNVDFIGHQVMQGLIAIRAKFLGEDIPPTAPALCQVVPLTVDRQLVPDRLNHIEYYGYDFNTDDGNLKMYLVRKNGARSDVTNMLHIPTHYAMTLTFGANGVQLNDQSERLVLNFQGRTLSTIAIIQPTTPVCLSKKETLPKGTKVTYIPPYRGGGDADYDGHGPNVFALARLDVAPGDIKCYVYMRAAETESNWTSAFGNETFIIYSPPSGYEIDSINLTDLDSSQKYTDSNHAIDYFNFGGGEPAKRFAIRGDSSGNDAGSSTGITIDFNEFEINLTQNEDCVSDAAVTDAHRRGFISPTAYERLQPGVIREKERRLLPSVP